MSHARFRIRVYEYGYMVDEWNGVEWNIVKFCETYWGARFCAWRTSRRPAPTDDVVWEGW